MANVQFYHLTTTPLERALPKLLEKAFAGGFRTLLLADSEDKTQGLSELLWTYDPASFLPHGTAKDGPAGEQPILISATLENANDANILVVTNGHQADAGSYERILDIFDGRDESAVAGARARWKSYKESGHEVNYLRQTPQGGWEKAA